jgi:hypothetical protein
MAIFNATQLIAPVMGERKASKLAKLAWSLTAAFATIDTYEAEFRVDGYDIIIDSANFYSVPLDSNAAPTSRFVIGDTAANNNILTVKGGAVGLINALPSQLHYACDGVLLRNRTRLTGNKIVITPTVNAATPVVSGDLFLDVFYSLVAR